MAPLPFLFPWAAQGDDGWGRLGDYTVTYAWFLGLQLLDLMTTLAVLGRGGGEANPAAAAALQATGPTALLAWKLAVILLSLAVWVPAAAWVARAPQPTRRWAAPVINALVLAACLVYTAVVFHNLRNYAILDAR